MMTPELSRLVGAICPDFPKDKQIKSIKSIATTNS